MMKMVKNMMTLETNKIIENIAFEGGGVKGVAYGGAISALESNVDMSMVKNVAGTSAGSIAAFLLSIGLTGAEITNILSDTQFKQFQDETFGLIRNIWRLFYKYGICSGDTFVEWARQILESKHLYPDITFADFERIKQTKNLFIVATNVTKGCSEVFSHETTPNVRVVDALRMSMSIPFYYAAVKYNNCHYVDGGVLNNYPIRIFDDIRFNPNLKECNGRKINPNTIGFRLDTTDELKSPAKTKTTNIINFAISIFDLIYGYAQNNILDEGDWERTIRICIDNVSAVDFNLTNEQKLNMVKSGFNSTKEFLQAHNYANIE